MNRAMVAAIVIVLGTVGFGQTPQSKPSGLQGTWRVAETNLTAPPARTTTNSKDGKGTEGLIIFMGTHYSVTQQADGRPPLADAAKASADELRNTWGARFASHAGTFEASNGIVRMHPLIGKNPADMTTAGHFEFSYKMEGNTLWLTSVRTPSSAKVPNPYTARYTRVE